MRREGFVASSMAPADWAKGVVQDLLKSKPPALIWRGHKAMLARLGSILPCGTLDGVVKKSTKMDQIDEILKAA